MFFTLLCLFLLLIPFWIKIPADYISIWLIISSLFCFNVCIINHNHVHTEIFYHPILNQLFGILLTLAKGHTSAGVVLAHNYNHHVYNGNENDWIRPQLAGNGPGLFRLTKFIFNSMITMAKEKRKVDKTILPKKVRQQLLLERNILLLFIFILMYIDITNFFIFITLPWVIGIVLLIGVNLLQHDQCFPTSKYNHSRNFIGRLGNWFFFNNGYHTAHHMDPSVHWSELPTMHNNKITQNIDKNLEKKSILLFLISHYLVS